MITYNLHHVDGLYFQLLDDEGKNREYDVVFVDRKTEVPGLFHPQQKTIYETKLKPGGWARLSRKHLSDIAIFVKYEGRTIKQINLLDELKGKRVFIVFESKSLGDSIAWIPYCLQMQELYKCQVIVSTFKNELFESVYPELTFVPRGMVVHDIIARVEFGWFWDDAKEPVNPVTIPLQKTASNILAMEFEEIRPRIAFTPEERPVVNQYICISTKSTSQCKHWYYWPELIQQLKNWGYRVFELSQEADDYGAETLEDKSLSNVMNYLHHADLYIGLSSGISWLNWAVGKHTVMISNFTKADHEFQEDCTRITNLEVCNGCWNNPLFRFNKGDWMWCPEHEDTPRQFECHKEISVQTVIDKIKPLL
jgi:autotransporter strand-loop-strand O-heptosyltransferase